MIMVGGVVRTLSIEPKASIFLSAGLVYYGVGYLLLLSIGLVFNNATIVLLGMLFLSSLRFLISRIILELELVFVVFLSAYQNVFLALLGMGYDENQTKILIVANLFFSIIVGCWVLMLFFMRSFSGDLSRMVCLLLGLSLFVVFYCLFTAAIAHVTFGSAALASLRNLMSPFMYTLLGVVIGASSHSSTSRFARAVVWIGLSVFIFGVIERFIYTDLWIDLDIGRLWQGKGIDNIAAHGFPRNWYSAETINGEQIRRMASSFGDPVNLGTFLFLYFICGFIVRSRVTMVIATVGVFLVISKGGLLGILVFCVVYARKFWPPTIYFFVSFFSAILGAAFVVYSLNYATGSMLLHVQGAVNGVFSAFSNPLGKGLGNVGTLAQQFKDLGDQEIVESGIGMIIGQIGVPGFISYLALFFVLLKSVRKADPRMWVASVSLSLGIFLNIIFNEVALSPNSSAGYFSLLGLILTSAIRARDDRGGMERYSNRGAIGHRLTHISVNH